ncbi:MAG: FkbM family methyltransferase [Anaerolineae bacterium]|nr:FkbM family methyltransferase [Anaerolineae bacterium]
MRLREFAQLPERRKHPEFHELYIESDRAKLAMSRIITSSMNCIDIGAHLGSVLNLINRLSPHGQHFAVEPIPYKYKWLKQKYPNVKILQIALGDTAGEAEFFFQPQQSGFSGLRPHCVGDAADSVEIFKTKIAKLDEVIPPHLPIGFMKIDVEGGELAVLKGSERIMRHDKPIILFECTQTGLEAHDVTLSEVYTFFEAHRYSIFLIKDWLSQRSALSFAQFEKSMEHPAQAFNFLAVPQE